MAAVLARALGEAPTFQTRRHDAGRRQGLIRHRLPTGAEHRRYRGARTRQEIKHRCVGHRRDIHGEQRLAAHQAAIGGAETELRVVLAQVAKHGIQVTVIARFIRFHFEAQQAGFNRQAADALPQAHRSPSAAVTELQAACLRQRGDDNSQIVVIHVGDIEITPAEQVRRVFFGRGRRRQRGGCIVHR